MVEPETLCSNPWRLVEARAACRDGKCERVTVHNVPSFVSALDAVVEVSGVGTVSVDIAYGGAFFAIVDAPSLGFSLTPDEARDLVEMGETIKTAVVEQQPVAHPENPDIHTVTFTEFTAPVAIDPDGVKTGQNAVVISPGKIDRSPCGTGTSARLAVLHARGQIAPDEPYRSTSLIGSVFHAEIVATAIVGDQPAIVPSLTGRSWITGFHQYTLDPSDPFPQGYTLLDTWYRML